MEEKIRGSKKPSKLWYLLPIFLNIIGGLIGYIVFKDKDKKFAERLLIVGLVMLVVSGIFQYLFVFLYSWGVYSGRDVLVPCSPCFSYFAYVNHGDGRLMLRNGPRNIIITDVDGGILSGQSGLGPGDDINIVGIPTVGDATITIYYQDVNTGLTHVDNGVIHSR